MARRSISGTAVFLDAAFAIALACRGDEHHERARVLSRDIQERRIRVLTTHGILLEIGNALSRPVHRAAATALLDAALQDPLVEILPLDASLLREALDLFRERPDQDWGLTDCASFAVMRREAVTESLTCDEHFEQAGFVALLR